VFSFWLVQNINN